MNKKTAIAPPQTSLNPVCETAFWQVWVALCCWWRGGWSMHLRLIWSLKRAEQVFDVRVILERWRLWSGNSILLIKAIVPCKMIYEAPAHWYGDMEILIALRWSISNNYLKWNYTQTVIKLFLFLNQAWGISNRSVSSGVIFSMVF